MSVAEAKIAPRVFESVNYFDHKAVGKDVPRWVFFPGDTIVAARKADIEWLAPGGEETSSPCLQKYGRGFVPRGRASLLEIGGELIPAKHLGDLSTHAWSGVALSQEVVKSRLSFIPVYPGDGLAILRAYYSLGGKRGLDEVTALQGRSWNECHNEDGTGILDVIEQACYGDGVEPTLRGLADQIRYAKVSDSRIDFGRYQANTLRMCDEFRLWGEQRMAQENANIKLGTKGEWVFAYSPLAELLITQLEMTRQDQPLQEMARMHGDMLRMAQPAGLSAADLAIIQQQVSQQVNMQVDEKLSAARAKIAELEAQLTRKEASRGKLVRRSVMRQPQSRTTIDTSSVSIVSNEVAPSEIPLNEIADESGSE